MNQPEGKAKERMKRQTVAVSAVIGCLALGVMVLGAKCLQLGEDCRQLREKVREYEQSAEGASADAQKAKPVADREAAPGPTTPAASSASEAVPSTPPKMAVVKVDYDGDATLDVQLSERPDMDVVRRYVTVEPLAEGRLTFKYQAEYDGRKKRYSPHLRIRGEFAYRTNVVLRIRRGLPLYGKGANPAAEGGLEADFVHTFRRRDQEPYVSFRDDGRYLPPVGARQLAVESVNVAKLHTAVRRVEPRNVVQMLAREEHVYAQYSWDGAADDEETKELSGAPVARDFRCANKVNVKEVTNVPVAVSDGKSANGIYLVSILNADRPVHKCRWNDAYNPVKYRVVCLSDLGLSVRGIDEDRAFGVWVTSLSRGVPLGHVWIEVYSSANTLVFSGSTDERGWCRPKRVAEGAPFAVVAIAENDMTFMALRDSMRVDETHPDGAREAYLKPGETRAFLWTDRGIYRHGEPIFAHAILRGADRRAPKPLPVELVLRNPKGDDFLRETQTTDAFGALSSERFAVPAEQPSGVWTLVAKLPGKTGAVLAVREVKVEEFAPPQIRVNVEASAEGHPSNFTFQVAAEHLFGGPAHGLRCEGAVVFEDAAFAPAGWKGWHFGNDDLGLKPNYREIKGGALDREGRHVFTAPLWADDGRPKAAVRVIAQGVVFEDGGRPATARKSVVRHFYPHYVGSTCPGWMKREQGRRPRIAVACVGHDGRRLGVARRLQVKVERIDSVYSYRTMDNGWHTWDCERIRSDVASFAAEAPADRDASIELPIDKSGDYAVTVTDVEAKSSFARSFYLSDWGDDVVRAPLANPTEVAIATDKAFYREGEAPHLTVKAPFAGFALLSVMRDKEAYTEVLDLTNATSEVTLRPVAANDAPNLDVYVSVIQSVAANERHMAVRAHGQATVRVRPTENELAVAVEADTSSLTNVDVRVSAPGADFAVVTVVDEAINLLTGEATPNPVGRFAEPCEARHPLFDLYHRILPVLDDGSLRVSGVKTGGGFGAEMLGRVSPVPTRRFRPLALWRDEVPVVDGVARVAVPLPEFVGEVRVTALAYSAKATGAASVQRKVTPKLVTMPDAPRFVAPGDVFEAALPIYNRSGEDATFGFEIRCGDVRVASRSLCRLAKDASTNVVARVTAPDVPGELKIRYHVRGMGEVHDQTILLPVRPAVAWQETAGVERVARAEDVKRHVSTATEKWSYRVYDSPVGELAHALEWLADYPHGCLEQTASRIFPLVSAGGVLASVGSSAAANRAAFVAAGVARVESMVRANDFVMWPDCNTPPWDREVSLYAAHFLVEAERSGQRLSAKPRVMGFLKKWAMSTNTAVSAYACQTLALAGSPEKDRMFRLYDGASALSLLSRARLARAFVAVNDRPRATALLRNASSPDSVKEAAFLTLALLELEPDDGRILPLVEYLNARRDRKTFGWGTTEENAHALLALGEYHRYHPPKPGEKYVSWKRLSLPRPEEVRDESSGLRIARRFLKPEGGAATLDALRRGELLVVELAVSCDDSRTLNDLVVEDLFAGAVEPVHGPTPPVAGGTNELCEAAWVMRHDVRDDRMLVFSKRFHLKKGEAAVFRYPVRVVSAGDYALPGPSVEAMYAPTLRARLAPTRIRVPAAHP